MHIGRIRNQFIRASRAVIGVEVIERFPDQAETQNGMHMDFEVRNET